MHPDIQKPFVNTTSGVVLGIFFDTTILTWAVLRKKEPEISELIYRMFHKSECTLLEAQILQGQIEIYIYIYSINIYIYKCIAFRISEHVLTVFYICHNCFSCNALKREEGVLFRKRWPLLCTHNKPKILFHSKALQPLN